MAMGDVREDKVISDSQGNIQKQTAVRHSSPASFEDPSIIKWMLENQETLDYMSRILAGYVPVPSDRGLTWEQRGDPLMNSKGRAWLMSHYLTLTARSFALSNFDGKDIRAKLEAEYRNTALHLAKHLQDYDVPADGAVSVLFYFMRAVYAAYSGPVGDRSRRHYLGAIDESVSTTPQRGDKILGIIPRF
jgi:hypothetical protein